MQALNLWHAWSIEGPWSVAPLKGGVNKRMWYVESVAGQKYVLRLTTDSHAIPRLRYETALLEAIAAHNPPFLLALPLRSTEGDIIVPCEFEPGSMGFASLYPFLSGQRLERENDLATASDAGAKLAILDTILATIPDHSLPAGGSSSPPFGELDQWHPLVPDPLTAVERLPIEQDQIRQIQQLLARTIEKAIDLYNRLPTQLLHRDYDVSNVLIADNKITAVLDFEFVGRDLRVLDPCIALCWWPFDVLGTGKEWAIIDAFGKSYTSQLPLSESELLALPDMFRLRDATSFVHRMGRYLAGQETDTIIQRRVQQSLWRENWLSAHHATLLQYALAWLKA